MALQQKIVILLAAILIHAATGMALGLIALIERVVRRIIMQRMRGNLQMLMLFPGPALEAFGRKGFRLDAHRQAGLAMLAMGAINVMSAAPEAGLY